MRQEGNHEIGALAPPGVSAHDGSVPSNDAPPKHIPALLDAAIKDADTNVTALARKWAQLTGVQTESKRRLLQKYRKGESVPDEPGAIELARLLGKPSTYLVTTRRRVSRRDLDAVWSEIAAIYQAIGELERALDR